MKATDVMGLSPRLRQAANRQLCPECNTLMAEMIVPAIHHVFGGKVHVSGRMAKKIIDANAFEYLI